MITICSIDPGLDRLSVAEFRIPARTGRWHLAGIQDKMRTFVQVHHATTAPSQGLAERLEAIARATHRIVTSITPRPELVIVELPAAAGTYRRLQGQQGDQGIGGRIRETMMVSHYATGAIIAAARTIVKDKVLLEKAKSGGKGNTKEARLETVRQLLISIGRRAEVRNADDLDAIAVGLQAEWPF